MAIFASATVVFVALSTHDPLFEKLIQRALHSPPLDPPIPIPGIVGSTMSKRSSSGSSGSSSGSSSRNMRRSSSSLPAPTFPIPQSSSPIPGTPRIHAVTYASHSGKDDRFCRAVESAVRHNISLVILGWGVPWRGLSQKLEAAHAYAASLPSRDVVLFTDAFDVMWAATMDTISARFRALQSEIVFSAECGCWPHVVINESICLTSYPEAPTPYRYLNSGTWMGFAEPSARMLDKVIAEAGANFTDANDQKLIADLYIAQRFGIQLDFYNKIFQSMHLTLDPPLPRCNPTKDVIQDEDAGKKFFNRRTQSHPSIFHFNGGGKMWHLRMEAQQWYKRRALNTGPGLDLLNRARVGVPSAADASHTMAFGELCGNYTRDLASYEWRV